MPPRLRVSKPPSAPPPALGAADFTVLMGLDIPDPITFAISPQWLDRPLYPKQATLLKVIFLRTDLLTEYDHAVIDEWEQSFIESRQNGIVPNIRTRMAYLKAMGYRWFREVLLVMGRRAGKGYISAIAMSYVLWCYLATGDPQEAYQIQREKKMEVLIYAGKKDQAKANLWGDLRNIIIGAPCYTKYVNRALGESLSVYAPADLAKISKLANRGINVNSLDLATFLITPREATQMSGRGGASCIVGLDEFAHVTTTLAKTSSELLYGSVKPSLDQFKQDAFMIEPSSPWAMTGQFYANWEDALKLDELTGEPLFANKMFLQLHSWQVYEDYARAHEIPLFPEDFEGDLKEYVDSPHPRLKPLRLAVQEYDDEMKREELANPELFAVERRAYWQATIDAYLDPKKIAAMWDENLVMSNRGKLNLFYKAHVDPSMVNDNFAIAIAHTEIREDGWEHIVFDWIQSWHPYDFPDNTIDYLKIESELWDLVKGFPIDHLTFDQFNSASLIANLNAKARAQSMPKRINIGLETATAPHNLKVAESFKMALNLGWVHSPPHVEADLELRFLQFKNGKVVHQDTGPVIHDDIARCMMEVTDYLLSSQIQRFLIGEGPGVPVPALHGGATPWMHKSNQQDEHVLSQFAALAQQRKALGPMGDRFTPTRGRPDFNSATRAGRTGYHR